MSEKIPQTINAQELLAQNEATRETLAESQRIAADQAHFDKLQAGWVGDQTVEGKSISQLSRQARVLSSYLVYAETTHQDNAEAQEARERHFDDSSKESSLETKTPQELVSEYARALYTRTTNKDKVEHQVNRTRKEDILAEVQRRSEKKFGQEKIEYLKAYDAKFTRAIQKLEAAETPEEIEAVLQAYEEQAAAAANRQKQARAKSASSTKKTEQSKSEAGRPAKAVNPPFVTSAGSEPEEKPAVASTEKTIVWTGESYQPISQENSLEKDAENASNTGSSSETNPDTTQTGEQTKEQPKAEPEAESKDEHEQTEKSQETTEEDKEAIDPKSISSRSVYWVDGKYTTVRPAHVARPMNLRELEAERAARANGENDAPAQKASAQTSAASQKPNAAQKETAKPEKSESKKPKHAQATKLMRRMGMGQVIDRVAKINHALRHNKQGNTKLDEVLDDSEQQDK